MENPTTIDRSKLIWLHIGGEEAKEGWKILNALPGAGVDFLGDVRDLSQFSDGCCEKVYASHVMEHLGQKDFLPTLREIQRILCKGGTFYFAVPDLEGLCKMFLSPGLSKAQRFFVMKMIYGAQVNEYDFHYIGLTEEFMKDYFYQAYFSSARRVSSFGLFDDTSEFKPNGFQISLNYIAYK